MGRYGKGSNEFEGSYNEPSMSVTASRDSGFSKDNSGGDKEGGNSNWGYNWYDRDAVNAVNRKSETDFAEGILDEARTIYKEMGIDGLKAFSLAAASLLAGNPISAAFAVFKGDKAISKKKKAAIVEAAKQLVSKFDIAPSRMADTVTALTNEVDRLRSAAKNESTATPSHGAEHDPLENVTAQSLLLEADKVAKEASQIKTRSKADGETQTYTDKGGDHPLWENFVNEFFETAYPSLVAQSDAVKTAIDERTNTLDRLKDNQVASLDKYTKGINDYTEAYQSWANSAQGGYNNARDKYTASVEGATTAQNSLLDRLSNQLESNSRVTPMSFSIGGQQYSFIPNSQKDTLSRLADIGQAKYNNTLKSASNINDTWLGIESAIKGLQEAKLKEVTEGAKAVYDAERNLAESLGRIDQEKLKIALAKAQANPDAEYIKQLLQVASQENAVTKTDNLKNLEQQKIDQNEPGMLDKLKGFTSLASSVADLYSSF